MRKFLLYLVDEKNHKEIGLFIKEYSYYQEKSYFMPISSQGPMGIGQGSETRGYNPERIMNLHERLGILEQDIYYEYFN